MGVRLTRQDDERARERERDFMAFFPSLFVALSLENGLWRLRGGGSVREGRSKKKTRRRRK